MFVSPMLTAIIPGLGENWPHCSSHAKLIVPDSILEYVSQDDADYAVRKLDNRELRGVPVRVEVDVGTLRCPLLCYLSDIVT